MWIKCSERLPEDAGNYLAHATSKYGCGIIKAYYAKTPGVWVSGDEVCSVTRWMPLPDPPKEDA